MTLLNSSASRIQKYWKNWRIRRFVEAVKNHKYFLSAVTVQKYMRGYIAMKVAKDKLMRLKMDKTFLYFDEIRQ